MSALHVFLDRYTSYQLVGSLEFAQSSDGSEGGTASFAYADSYLNAENARPISLSLPLGERSFGEAPTKAFFDGLLPEGRARAPFEDSLHAGADDYAAILARLSDETMGALVFSREESISSDYGHYVPASQFLLQSFARRPRRVAFEVGMATRLSLAGAESKLGLYHAGEDFRSGWFLPQGTAPSTHIIKAADGTFENQTVNEAICLLTAKYCEFDVPDCRLVPVEGAEPLLVVERFDRRVPESPRALEGNSVPRRLHQEDFCQASGLTGTMKYAPTQGNYLNRCADVIRRESSNPFGDRAYFLQRVYFDFFIGNCDNHLKNHAMLWDEELAQCAVAPLYDVTCTTVYEHLDREMGVPLCPSRKIDDVTAEDLLAAAKELGVSEKIARSLLNELRDSLLPALDQAEAHLGSLSIPIVEAEADKIRKDVLTRLMRS